MLRNEEKVGPLWFFLFALSRPTTILLLACGLAGLAGLRKRFKK